MKIIVDPLTGKRVAALLNEHLYLKSGFEYCGPFGNYRDDPFSRFMTLAM